LADNAVTIGKTDNLFVNTEISGTEAARMPVGTTAQRASAQVGDLRHNTTIDILEQYTSTGWQGIASPPVAASISPTDINESDSTQTIVITGSNFDSSATGSLKNSSSATVSPTTSTRNSSSQITIVFSGGDAITTDAGPYDVVVTNGSGLSATLEDALTLDNTPVWSTSAGSLGTVYEDLAMSTATIAASDPEGGSVTYSVTSGALPTGTSLGSSNGQITGTPNVGNSGYSSSGVTHNFTVTANDGTGNTAPRAFSILRKWYDGSTSALAAPSGSAINALGISSGMHWLKPAGISTAVETFVDNTYDGGGWTMVFAYHKGRTPLQNVSSYAVSPLAAAGTAAQTATPNDPNDSFIMPANFWTSTSFNRELREEWNIHGGTWPSNTNRVAIYHGGRTSAGAMNTNYLTSTETSNSRLTLAWQGRDDIRMDHMTKSRHGYLSNTVNKPTQYTTGGDSILGISVDPSNLVGSQSATTDGTNNYTNDNPSSGSSWMGRGNGYTDQGTSRNGANPDGTRWGLVWLR
jgi:hypothetical protein